MPDALPQDPLQDPIFGIELLGRLEEGQTSESVLEQEREKLAAILGCENSSAAWVETRNFVIAKAERILAALAETSEGPNVFYECYERIMFPFEDEKIGISSGIPETILKEQTALGASILRGIKVIMRNLLCSKVEDITRADKNDPVFHSFIKSKYQHDFPLAPDLSDTAFMNMVTIVQNELLK
jgi:hypothetical protein